MVTKLLILCCGTQLVEHYYNKVNNKKVKSVYEPRGMKRRGVLLLPPGWDASPSQGYPQQ